MYKRLILLASACLLALTLGACAAPEAEPAAPPAAETIGQAGAAGGDDPLGLDTSCRVDSDCEVKNVGNCCGYFPACVNASARPDPEAVQARCAETGMASVCGFREIQACSCVRSRCQAVHRSLEAPLE